MISLGCIFGAIAFFGFSVMSVYPSYFFLAVFFGIYGLSFGLVNACSIPAALEFIPAEHAGISSGKSIMIRWLGGAAGSAIMAMMFVSGSLKYLISWGQLHHQFVDTKTMHLLNDVIVGHQSEAAVYALFNGKVLALAKVAIGNSYHHGITIVMVCLAILSLVALVVNLLWVKQRSS